MNQEIASPPALEKGVVAGADEGGRPLVSVDGGAPQLALAVQLSPRPNWALCAGLPVLLGRVGQGEELVITGLLEAAPHVLELHPDKDRWEARKELVIQCGKAKISLRADGRIEVRGGHLVSRSTGPNKVKGASVHIN